jgi:hypothetical protein
LYISPVEGARLKVKREQPLYGTFLEKKKNNYTVLIGTKDEFLMEDDEAKQSKACWNGWIGWRVFG